MSALRSGHLASGFSELIAFVCVECGEVVTLSDDDNIGRFFGSGSAPEN